MKDVDLGRTASVGRSRARDDTPVELRQDVRRLTEALGRILLEDEGPGLLDAVEHLRKVAIAERFDTGGGILAETVSRLELDRLESIVRAFTLYFQLAGLAEQQHRIRVLRERSHGERPVEDSLAEAVEAIRRRDGEDALRALADRLEVTPVLTAHPTEARRRSVQEGLARIATELETLDDPRTSRSDAEAAERRILEGISTLWRTDPLRSHRPGPLDEVRGVMVAFDDTLFRLVPVVYRELDRLLSPQDAGERPALARPFLRLGSWIGGDRDGNPTVTADVTRQTLAIHTEHLLRGLEAATRRIGRSLTVSQRTVPPTEELAEALAEDEARFEELGSALRQQVPEQPHRRKMLLVAHRLASRRTRGGEGYASVDDYVRDLRIVQDSLARGGAPRLAYGEVQNLLWQAETFGFHLASLEVRQHSSVHERVLTELLGDTASDATALDAVATQGRADAIEPASDEARETIETLQAMHLMQRRFGSEACRRYVVSFTRSATDIIAPAALARLAVPDGSLEIDVVPLFESRADLEHAIDTLDAYIGLPGVKAWLDRRGRRMEVMLGYSDSAKDAGFLAGNVALHAAQAAMARWAQHHGITLTLFHGRGGALGRGGGPTNRAIQGQAAGSVDGRFKVTEQGEMIFERYGRMGVAARHLEQVTGAVLLASSPSGERESARGSERWLETAERMARASEDAYRELVEADGFGDFFGRATPIAVIERMRIGSRPARRDASRDLQALRAIPWVFSWSQARCEVPGWYGVGVGLESVVRADGGAERLREMYGEWAFFRAILQSVEMSLAKTDLTIARDYLALGDRPDLARMISDEYARTVDLLLGVTGQERLLGSRPLHRATVELRTPYVDVLSRVQLRVLRESHTCTDDERRTALEQLALLTVEGIAAGLQSTG